MAPRRSVLGSALRFDNLTLTTVPPVDGAPVMNMSSSLRGVDPIFLDLPLVEVGLHAIAFVCLHALACTCICWHVGSMR